MVRIAEQNNNKNIQVRTSAASGNVSVYNNTDVIAEGLAKDWAIKTDGKVDGIDYSSKYYAAEAKTNKEDCQTLFNNTKQQADLAKSYAEQAESAVLSGIAPATSQRLGGIIVGDNLSVTQDGTLSATVSASDINSKQDVLTAGNGISISNNVISSTQPALEWGNISGNLNAQTDLQNALNQKPDISDLSGYVTTQQFGNTSSAGIVKPDGETIIADSNGKISVDSSIVNTVTNNSSTIAGYTMPSNISEAVTVGASGATYTAPANGYYYCTGTSSAASGRINLVANGIRRETIATAASQIIDVDIMVKKNDILTVSWGSVTISALYFIYADGSKDEAP